MNVWGWICLIIAIASCLGILYVDWRYQQRDSAERQENAQDDADWWI